MRDLTSIEEDPIDEQAPSLILLEHQDTVNNLKAPDSLYFCLQSPKGDQSSSIISITEVEPSEPTPNSGIKRHYKKNAESVEKSKQKKEAFL